MRSKKAPKRLIKLDPVYNSRLVSRLINKVMFDGKKTVAESLVYKAFEKIKDTTKQDPIAVFEKAINNISPRMEVRPRRVGGASYQVPMEVRGDRKETLAVRWLITAARERSNESLRAANSSNDKNFRTFDNKLALEIMDAANETGGAFKRKEDVQKVAAANRAFAHFRW